MVKISTGTADGRLAEKLLPKVLDQWSALEAKWERRLQAAGGPSSDSTAAAGVRSLTNQETFALAGLWYRRLLHDFEAHPEAATAWDGFAETAPAHPFDEDEDPGAIANGTARVRPEYAKAEADFLALFTPHVSELLASVRVVADAPSRERLARIMAVRTRDAIEQWSQRQKGDYRPDPVRARFPDWHPRANSAFPSTSAPEVSLRALFEAWKRVAVVKARVIEETRYIVEALIIFLGHDNAARISREDLVRWRDAAKADGRSNNTWNNRLSMVRSVLLHGVSEGLLTSDPTTGLRLRKARQKSPPPYSDADATRILLAARRETRPSLRWAHWIMAFTGARAGEVLQLLGRDVRQDGSLWLIDINEDDDTKSVKTGQRRNVPIHPALVAEGFIAYAQTIGAEAPVFPDKGLDKFGKRGGRAWNVIGKWVRDKVGIVDPDKAPDHSWRHRVEDELRAVEAPEDVRDAIVGHARKTTGRQYGTRGEALSRLYRFLSLIPLPPGLGTQAPTGTPQAPH